MLVTKNFKKHFYISSFFSLISMFLFGCLSGTQATLPDAPPPYPDSPFPRGSVQNDYVPPPSPNPRGQFVDEQENTPSYSSSKTQEKVYYLEAIGTIWVLVQDKFGNELEWISLLSGERVPLQHSGSLTITCSSGESLKIFSPDGKPYQIADAKKGISIIRLP